MPKRRALTRVRDQLLVELSSCSGFVNRCRLARTPRGGRPALNGSQLAWAHEHALLKATVAWELFLESALAHYVVGERAPSGRLFARRRKLQARTIKEIRITFRGDSDFVSWLSAPAVTERAEEWLRGGGPFSNAL